MPLISRTLMLYLGLISLLGFVLISVSYNSHLSIRIDEWCIHLIQQWESKGLTRLSKWFSFIGSGWMTSILGFGIIVLLWLLKYRYEILIFLFAVCGSGLLNLLLKHLFGRSRPDIHPIIVETGFSFPSGHSMSAFTFYGIVTIILWTHIPNRLGKSLLIGFSIVMIVMIGLSRVYLGVHYPSDIIGAYLASFCWLIVMVGLLRYSRR